MKVHSEHHSTIHSSFANDEMLADLVQLFVGELPDRVKTLEDAYADSDFELLQRTAHQLKGAFGSYGFHSLTAPSSQLEASLAQKDSPEKIRQHLDELVEFCERVSAAVGPVEPQ